MPYEILALVYSILLEYPPFRIINLGKVDILRTVFFYFFVTDLLMLY